MQVLGNRMLVRRINHEKTRASGIIIPNQVADHTFMGEVIKTGPGMMNDAGERLPMSVTAGDMILYTSTSGYHVEVETGDGKKEFTILNERDVLAVLEDDDIKKDQ